MRDGGLVPGYQKRRVFLMLGRSIVQVESPRVEGGSGVVRKVLENSLENEAPIFLAKDTLWSDGQA